MNTLESGHVRQEDIGISTYERKEEQLLSVGRFGEWIRATSTGNAVQKLLFASTTVMALAGSPKEGNADVLDDLRTKHEEVLKNEELGDIPQEVWRGVYDRVDNMQGWFGGSKYIQDPPMHSYRVYDKLKNGETLDEVEIQQTMFWLAFQRDYAVRQFVLANGNLKRRMRVGIPDHIVQQLKNGNTEPGIPLEALTTRLPEYKEKDVGLLSQYVNEAGRHIGDLQDLRDVYEMLEERKTTPEIPTDQFDGMNREELEDAVKEINPVLVFFSYHPIENKGPNPFRYNTQENLAAHSDDELREILGYAARLYEHLPETTPNVIQEAEKESGTPIAPPLQMYLEDAERRLQRIVE